MRALSSAVVATAPLWIGCVQPADPGEPPATIAAPRAAPDLAHGRQVWFDNTYGGERFFAFLAVHPDPQRRIEIGFADVATTPRAIRFDVWGVINDPDCVADPDGGLDLCADPESSGVIGIRKKPGPDGTLLYGAACASCHAGFDPLHPPADPNQPTWDNIHPSNGNPHLRIGDIFAANLPPGDPRAILFAAWPPGTVDTTLLFDDGIMNPSVITQVWGFPHRHRFDVGLAEPTLRNGWGGEDDVGLDLAAIRVYTNIGVCFFECTLPAVQAGQPLDPETCRQACPDLPPQQDLDDLAAFISSVEAPQYPGWPVPLLYGHGRRVFDAACADCHERTGPRRHVLSDDQIQPLADDPGNATHACRALTEQWQEGRLWAAFSSPIYKARVAAGDRGYRTMTIAGSWSTSPLLHNQSIGRTPPADATPSERAAYWWEAMWQLLSAERPPLVQTLPVPLGPFPAGTPLQYVFSRDPATGALRCDDIIENRGHHHGAELSPWDKVALIHWLQLQ